MLSSFLEGLEHFLFDKGGKIMSNPIIKIENLKKTYKSKNSCVNAIENINLNINSGDIYGIIGLSGAGKSTLIRCINFLEKPTEGKVYFKGIDLSSLKNKELLKIRQNIGMKMFLIFLLVILMLKHLIM